MAENIKTEQHYYTKDFSGYRNEEDNFVGKYFAEERKNEKLEKENIKLKNKIYELQNEEDNEECEEEYEEYKED